MSTHFRAIWVFHQAPLGCGAAVKMFAGRRFVTVEKRVRENHHSGDRTALEIPSDNDVTEWFASCILRKSRNNSVQMPHLIPSIAHQVETASFDEESDSQKKLDEKEWPLGPTASIHGIWPFIFISTNSSYESISDSPRFFICGIVALFGSSERERLLNIPELSAAYSVLGDLANFLPLPSATPPSSGVASKFLFLLKSALPFGCPVETSAEILTELNSSSITARDSASIYQGSGNRALTRIPAWKPFPLQTGVSTGSQSLKIQTAEAVSFEVLDGDVRFCSVICRIICDTDIPGTPEIIVPVDAQHALSLHDCAKFVSTFQAQDEVSRISFIPPNGAFTLASLALTNPIKSVLFPLDLSFRLYQIAPTQFRFELSGKLRVLMTHFSIMFCVSQSLPIANLSGLAVTPKCRLDITNDTHVVWSYKNPHTYSDGETVSGLIETVRPLLMSEEIARSATVSFRIADNFFTKIKFMKENISFFPNIPKASVSLSYETVSAGNCYILNSSFDHGKPSVSTLDFNDCFHLTDEPQPCL